LQWSIVSVFGVSHEQLKKEIKICFKGSADLSTILFQLTGAFVL